MRFHKPVPETFSIYVQIHAIRRASSAPEWAKVHGRGGRFSTEQSPLAGQGGDGDVGLPHCDSPTNGS